MKQLGMIDGEPEPQEEIDVIRGRLSRTELNVTRGGLIDKFVDVGQPIKVGQLLGKVVNGYGEPVEDIVSTVDGWLLAWPMIHNQAAGSGDHVAFLAFPIEE